MKNTLPVLLASVLLCFASRAQDSANSVQMQVPSGPLLNASFVVTDSSQGRWISLPTQTLQSDENGFEASAQASPENKIDVHGKFEKAGNSLRCSVKWEAAAELPEAFMMFVFRFPIADFQDGVISANDGQANREISMAKILAGGPALSALANIPSFSMGPIEGKTVDFSIEDAAGPVEIGVIKTDTEFQIRFMITPRKSPLPASGTVAWSMTAG